MAAKDDTSPYDRAVTELTGVDPARFIARRKEIAQELHQAGDRDGTASVLAIRKPSATVALAK